MENRDYGKEIDELRATLEQLVSRLDPAKQVSDAAKLLDGIDPADLIANGGESEKLERVYAMHNMHPDERLASKMTELCAATDEQGVSGMITYLGVFESGGRQSNWIRNDVSTDSLLALVESGVAAKVLACIGSPVRLGILLAILRKPMTVAEIVEVCGLGSTGQAYHHMKPLLAADLIVEDEHAKGMYIIRPQRVQGIIMLLAGISDMVDENYTVGAWDAE